MVIGRRGGTTTQINQIPFITNTGCVSGRSPRQLARHARGQGAKPGDFFVYFLYLKIIIWKDNWGWGGGP